ncbi:MAG: sigma-54-dependent Fis family transcriptional regulator [Chrysiogenetes bacterium]|nr:sigma-54-dependent Fis family transcriptional regulator [Chrysiogenetes bacterium]
MTPTENTAVSVAVVDDEPTIRISTERMLRDEGYETFAAATGAEFLGHLEDNRPSVVLLDIKLPDMDGLELLAQCKQLSPDTEVILMTGYGTVESAVDAMKAGAFHYLTKPFKIEDVLNLVERAAEHRKLKTENVELRRQLERKYGSENFIGNSDKMQHVFRLIDRVADTDSTVLITGESGTGKELVARALHLHSSRRDVPMVTVNCAAVPEDLLESELFGHTKGAFTGAIATRQGKFQAAAGGTIFLDEVGEMTPSLQVKLLRVLQEKEVTPVGSEKSIKVDVRVIAATNRDLQREVEEGRFREDLFYRLNVIPITLPPLRDRKEDVPVLIQHFLQRFSREKNMQVAGISEDAVKTLARYPWPGNVRELENLLERMVVLKGEGQLTLEDLPEKFLIPRAVELNVPEVEVPEEGVDLKRLVDDFEDRIILSALNRTKWNKNRAATLLGIKRTTLLEKLKKKALVAPDERGRLQPNIER